MKKKCIKLTVRIDITAVMIDVAHISSEYAPIKKEINDDLKRAIADVISKYRDELYG